MQWKPIPNVDSGYEINENGEVRSFKKGEWKTLVPNLPEINHKNGIRSDNRIENLEWVTHFQNLRHASITGLFVNSGDKNKLTKLTDDTVKQIKERLDTREFTIREIAKEYGVTEALISHYARGYRTCSKNWEIEWGGKNRYVSKKKRLGENSPRAKLSTEQVVEIKRLLDSGVSQPDISKQFEIPCCHISSIKTGRIWSHV